MNCKIRRDIVGVPATVPFICELGMEKNGMTWSLYKSLNVDASQWQMRICEIVGVIAVQFMVIFSLVGG